MKLKHLEVLLMDNGEVICLGKTLGWEKDFGTYLKEPETEEKKK